MTTQQSIDQAKTDAFVGKVLADTAGLAVTVMSSIGDRLGLFKNLAELGPATSSDLMGAMCAWKSTVPTSWRRTPEPWVPSSTVSACSTA
jgi:hypothetical protein